MSKDMRVLLNVEDCARAIAFYRDGLGFEVLRQWGPADEVRFAALRNGEVEIMLNQPHGADSAGRRRRGTYSDVVIHFPVDCVHALWRDLKARGLEPSEPQTQDHGVDEMTLRDPDGYELGFTSPLDVSRSSLVQK